MKLYNKTKLPDSVLEPLLIAAGRAVGAKTSGVVVKVTQGRNAGVSGMAQSASFVNTWHLKRVSKWKSERVTTDHGWFRITIPWSRPGWDSLAVAQSFFQVAMHEWKHIADYQAGGRWAMPFASPGMSGRRARHDSRPEELRAIDAVDAALARGAVLRCQDAIIALAMEHGK
jgi:hypothetical protein